MPATIEIKVNDAGDDKPSRPKSSSGAGGGGVVRTQLLSPVPLPVRVVGGGSAGSPRAPIGGAPAAPRAPIGGVPRRSNTEALADRNRAIGDRSFKRVAALRDRARKKRQQDADRARKQQEREAEQEAAKVQREKDARVKRGQDRKRAMVRKRRMDRLRQQRQLGESLKAGAAGVVAAGVRGGGVGRAIGGGAGAAIGARFGGTAGAVVGGAVGEKVGGAVDDPLGGPAAFSKKVAAGDGVGALDSAANAAAIGLMAVPVAGPIAGAALKTFSAALGNTTEVLGAFVNRAKEIGMFSGAITGAAARQDITRLVADIKESQRMGESYAKLIDKQSEFEETMKAMLAPIKEYIIKYLPMMMDWMLDFAIWSIESLDKVLIGDYGLKAIAGEMRKARDDARRGAGAEFDMEAMFRADRGRPIDFPAPLPPAGPGGPGGLDIPIIPPRRP